MHLKTKGNTLHHWQGIGFSSYFLITFFSSPSQQSHHW